MEQDTADSHCNMAAKQTLSKNGMVVANHSRLSHPRVVILQHKGAGSAGSSRNHKRYCNAHAAADIPWMSLPLHSPPPPYPGGGSSH